MVLWVAFFLSCSSSGEAFHSDSQHVDAFENILKTMKLNNSLELQTLTTLLKNLGLQDCSDNTAYLHQCVTAKTLFDIFNITTTSSIKETEFAKIATVIVYSLLPVIENHSNDNHNKEKRFLTQKVDVYEELLQRYVTSGLCEHVLDQLLRDINESIGKRLNNHKCFSSDEILHEMNISNKAEITKSRLSELSTIIISKLVARQCIKVEHQTPLPCPSYFVDDLFQKFANNNFIDKKRMKELLRQLKIGNRKSTGDKPRDNVDHNHEHHNRGRRSTGTSFQSLSDNGANMESQLRNKKRFRREAKRLVKNIYKKCYSVDELFSIYQVDESTGANVERFQRLSSALLQQIESNVCSEEKQSKKDKKKISGVWGYGLAAVSVISLLSVIMIIPLMQTRFYNKALVFLISLAVGTLVGDALLHLLPHATGFHDHDSSNELGEGGLIYVDKDKSYLWKFLAAVAGVYGLFIFETTTHIFARKKRGEKQSIEQPSHSRDTMNKPGFIKSMPETTRPAVVLVNMITKRDEHSQISEKSVDGSSCETKEKTEQKKKIASMAWTIIIGDTIHNIADGIAIGVAFSENIFGGISTSIAVLCHEVPHELGDFVVLLEAGMTYRQALLANFVSSWFCFLGLILGKLIGEIEDVNLWILAITAGFFLYIALTDKLPELMRLSELSDLSTRSILILQNLGMILGFTGMLLLAFYKKDIDI